MLIPKKIIENVKFRFSEKGSYDSIVKAPYTNTKKSKQIKRPIQFAKQPKDSFSSPNKPKDSFNSPNKSKDSFNSPNKSNPIIY